MKARYSFVGRVPIRGASVAPPSAVGRLPPTGVPANGETAPAGDAPPCATFPSTVGRLPSTGIQGIGTISKSKSPDGVWTIGRELNSTLLANEKMKYHGFKPFEFERFRNEPGNNPGSKAVEFDRIKAHQFFGEQLPMLLDEFNEVLEA